MCSSWSEFLKEAESGFPLSSLVEAICCATVSAIGDFFMRLDRGLEEHARSIDQDLD